MPKVLVLLPELAIFAYVLPENFSKNFSGAPPVGVFALVALFSWVVMALWLRYLCVSRRDCTIKTGDHLDGGVGGLKETQRFQGVTGHWVTANRITTE